MSTEPAEMDLPRTVSESAVKAILVIVVGVLVVVMLGSLVATIAKPRAAIIVNAAASAASAK